MDTVFTIENANKCLHCINELLDNENEEDFDLYFAGGLKVENEELFNYLSLNLDKLSRELFYKMAIESHEITANGEVKPYKAIVVREKVNLKSLKRTVN